MGVTNSTTGTRVDEIADQIYRISTPSTGTWPRFHRDLFRAASRSINT